MKYYLVGIKGTGMTSLACMLKDLGHFVVGSDVDEEFFTDEILKKKKIEVLSFCANNITSDYTYIIGNAFDEKCEEVSKIILNDFEHYYYHEFIGHILDKNIISVAGTHGKTTTSYFLSQMLNKNVSYIIGDGSGYGTDATHYLVLEACEYKDHFLSYKSQLALITNIEFDHPDYFKNIKQVISSFQKFANKTKTLIVNGDDVNIRKIKHKNKITFGFDENNDFIIKIEKKNKSSYDILLTEKKTKREYKYNVPFLGKHMIYNYVGSIVISMTLGITPHINNLLLPKRRMKHYYYGDTIIIDDYAHHPTEIKCLFETLCLSYPDLKINVIFQPHTYSRTLSLLKEFDDALSLFDEVYIENVFTSAREKHSDLLEKKIFDNLSKYKKFNNDVLKNISRSKKEIWVFLGAGCINRYIKEIINQ